MAGRRSRFRWLTVAVVLVALLALVFRPWSTRGDAAPETVTVCGRSLCLGGAPWTLSMATVFNGLDTPQQSVARLKALGLTTVRITDFLDTAGSPSAAPYDEQAWIRVDGLIAAAHDAGLHVWLDLSTYRNLLKQAGVNPYTVDWTPFLSFVANRTNTVTGVRYAADPTIAVVGFAGEVDGINSADNTYGLTTQQLTDFYRRVENYWHGAAPRQLLTAGGLSNLDWDSGIDWHSIFALPYNAIAAVHAYTASDVQVTIPAVSAFAAASGRPWVLEEFGYPASMTDDDRARSFTAMFATARQYGAAGTGFWNVGGQTQNTYDVGPQFPATFAAVAHHAP